WYPSLRLFRQTRWGDWTDVFARIARELEKAVAAKGTRGVAPVPVAIGELLDKLTILEIKLERITDRAKRDNVLPEYELLRATRDGLGPPPERMNDLRCELKKTNELLWEIEDEIRDRERCQDFGPRFVELARSVYRQNDRRAALKRQINELGGSTILEEKAYR